MRADLFSGDNVISFHIRENFERPCKLCLCSPSDRCPFRRTERLFLLPRRYFSCRRQAFCHHRSSVYGNLPLGRRTATLSRGPSRDCPQPAVVLMPQSPPSRHGPRRSRTLVLCPRSPGVTRPCSLYTTQRLY